MKSIDLLIQKRKERLEEYKTIRNEIASYRHTITNIQFGNVAATIAILGVGMTIKQDTTTHPFLFLLPLLIYVPSLFHIIIRKRCNERNAAYLYVFFERPKALNVEWETRYHRPTEYQQNCDDDKVKLSIELAESKAGRFSKWFGNMKLTRLCCFRRRQKRYSFQVHRSVISIGFEVSALYLLLVAACLGSAWCFGYFQTDAAFPKGTSSFPGAFINAKAFLYAAIILTSMVIISLVVLTLVYFCAFDKMVRDYLIVQNRRINTIPLKYSFTSRIVSFILRTR